MATVSSTVTNLPGIAAGSGSDILNISAGTLTAGGLSSLVGYSTINITSNAAHVIDPPNTILSNT